MISQNICFSSDADQNVQEVNVGETADLIWNNVTAQVGFVIIKKFDFNGNHLGDLDKNDNNMTWNKTSNDTVIITIRDVQVADSGIYNLQTVLQQANYPNQTLRVSTLTSTKRIVTSAEFTPVVVTSLDGPSVRHTTSKPSSDDVTTRSTKNVTSDVSNDTEVSLQSISDTDHDGSSSPGWLLFSLFIR